MTRKKLFFIMAMLIFCLHSGCDKTNIVVEPSDSDNKIIFFTFTSDSTVSVSPVSDEVEYKEDSSLAITYKLYDDILGISSSTSIKSKTEWFNLILYQKIPENIFLNYGVLFYAGTKLGRKKTENNHDVLYDYLALRKDNVDSSAGLPWNAKFNLKETQALSSSGSEDMDGFTTTIPTLAPVEITNIISGSEISTNSDLTIKFSRNLKKGSIASIGYYDRFIKIEVFQSTDNITIPADDLNYLINNFLPKYHGRCYISISEGFLIGSLEVENKSTKQKTGVPIFEFTTHRKTLFLKN